MPSDNLLIISFESMSQWESWLAENHEQQDRRRQQAYDSHTNMIMPEEFLRELEKDPKAKAFFETLNKTNRYSIGFRFLTAKRAETREKRMKTILEMLARREKFH